MIDLDDFYQKLQSISAKTLWVALSGGLDSHVLLHLLASCSLLKTQGILLQAVHVNHHLSPHSQIWEQHCVAVCAALNITCVVLPVDATAAPGESPEAAARAARYAAFSKQILSGECIVTAHHQDDQAETLLLQLFRGAGTKGLSAMPTFTRLGQGYLFRPLLGITRNRLHAYAQLHGLQWIEDESNVNARFDRNYLRHHLMPLLSQRWPSISTTLSRSAQHCAQTESLLAELLQEELRRLSGSAVGTLSRNKLSLLPVERQYAILRMWLQSSAKLLPTAKQLQHIQRDIVASRYDAMPQVGWSENVVKRYRDDIYVLPRAPDNIDGEHFIWNLQESLLLSPNFGRLTWQYQQGCGIQQRIRDQAITVRFRQGGEHCRPVGRRGSRSLKKLFQEWCVPPWQRDKIPLLYLGNELVAVVGYCICEPFAVKYDEIGIVITLEAI